MATSEVKMLAHPRVKPMATHRSEVAAIIQQKMVMAITQHDRAPNDDRWIRVLDLLHQWQKSIDPTATGVVLTPKNAVPTMKAA